MAESVAATNFPTLSRFQHKHSAAAAHTALKKDRGRADALRQVELVTLKRKDGRHPFYWAIPSLPSNRLSTTKTPSETFSSESSGSLFLIC